MTPPMNTLLFVACGSTILSFLTTCEEKKNCFSNSTWETQYMCMKQF